MLNGSKTKSGAWLFLAVALFISTVMITVIFTSLGEKPPKALIVSCGYSQRDCQSFMANQIGNAKNEVFVAMSSGEFAGKDPELLNPLSVDFLNALIAASQRGVNVTIYVKGGFIPGAGFIPDETMVSRLKAARVKLIAYGDFDLDDDMVAVDNESVFVRPFNKERPFAIDGDDASKYIKAKKLDIAVAVDYDLTVARTKRTQKYFDEMNAQYDDDTKEAYKKAFFKTIEDYEAVARERDKRKLRK